MDPAALSESLRRWRWREAMAQGVTPAAILPNAALDGLVRVQPANLKELSAVPGLDAARAARYGPALVQLVLEVSEVRGPPLVDAAFDESAGSRDALRATLVDMWGAILASAAWSMAAEEPIPTASGKSHLIIDAVTPGAISYRAGKAGAQAVTRREVLAVARRVLQGAGRAFSLEELGAENSSHIAVFLSLAPQFETIYDRRVSLRARIDTLGDEARAAIAASGPGAATVP